MRWHNFMYRWISVAIVCLDTNSRLTWSGLGGGDEDWGCKVCGGGYLGVSWGLRVGVEIVES